MSLDERYFVDFAQRGYPVEHTPDRALAQERHAVLPGRALDFRRGPSFENHVTDAVRQIHQLTDRGPSFEPRAAAFDAAGALVKRVPPCDVGWNRRLREQFGRDGRLLLAVPADLADQPLCEHA